MLLPLTLWFMWDYKILIHKYTLRMMQHPSGDLQQTITKPSTPHTPSNNLINYKVFVRCRPLSEPQLLQCQPSKRQKVVRKHDNTLYLYQPDSSISVPLKFDFERVFLQTDRNVEIYKSLADSIDSFMSGFNTSILAYGMTGAGKSHTMFGSQYCEDYGEDGVVAMVVREVLGRMAHGDQLKMGFMELYNEQLRDLLVEKSENLNILEDASKCTSVPQLTQHNVSSYQDFMRLLKIGCAKRAVASTHSNSNSSRSHSIIQMCLTQNYDSESISSKLFFVDLAGSERAGQSRGLRLQQGSNINKSLLALGNCINSLGDSNKGFVPYRDSKLTRLLKDSLGGNSKTVLIVCISPSFTSYQQTLHALKYASRALRIKREVTPNVSKHESQLEYLRREVARLRVIIADKENANAGLTQNKENLHNMQNSPKWGKLEREVETLKKALVRKDLIIMEKDQTIRRLEKQLKRSGKPQGKSERQKSKSKSPLRISNISNLSNQPKALKDTSPAPSRQLQLPSTPTLDQSRPKSSGRCLPSTTKHQVVPLQIARERSRVFKHSLRRLYSEYQNLNGQKMPLDMVERIFMLSTEHAKGNIMLAEDYTKMLGEFRNLVSLQMSKS